ncbi:MAG: Crp/Fnr family transcriptional regulator [Chitinophagaceae bacterium]|nr:Crp/Fnr family transcriptional regulator [Chitinophagaceae bacterium]
MDSDLMQVKKVTDAIHPLSQEDWEAFASIWMPFTAKRKQILTTVGSREKYLYFVLTGVQRVYYFDDLDREATLVFTYPPSFGGVLDAFLLQQPAKYFYETLSPSTFLRAPYSELEELMVRVPAVETFIRKGLSGVLGGVMERLAELQCYSSEEKLQSLLKRSAHILQLVPHKYLANYLGIDPTNFSKLINKIKW